MVQLLIYRQEEEEEEEEEKEKEEEEKKKKKKGQTQSSALQALQARLSKATRHLSTLVLVPTSLLGSMAVSPTGSPSRNVSMESHLPSIQAALAPREGEG